MVESLFWNPAFDVAPAARWWAMSKDWWRLRPGAFLAPASYFFVLEPRILGDPWTVGEAKHHSCFLTDIVSVERGHQKPFVRTPLVLQTINQLIKIFTLYDTRTCLVSISPKLSMFHLCSLLFNKINQELPIKCQKRQSRNRWLHMKKKQMTNYYRNIWGFDKFNYHDNWSTLSAGKKVLIVSGWIEDLDCGWMESPRSAAATIWSFRRPKVRTSAPEIMVFFPKSQVFMAFGSNFFLHFSERTKTAPNWS